MGIFMSKPDNELMNKVKELENTVKKLTSENKKQKEELDFYHKCPIAEYKNMDDKENTKGVSIDKINEFVDEILGQKETNCAFLPDFIERRLYKNFFDLGLRLMQKTTSTVKIELLGHKMHIEMYPCELKSKKDEPLLLETDQENNEVIEVNEPNEENNENVSQTENVDNKEDTYTHSKTRKKKKKTPLKFGRKLKSALFT